MVDLISLLGFTAGICTTVSFVPQVIKSWKTKETKDLSFWMLILLVIGITLWLAYGTLTKDVPIILANGASLLLTLLILIMKIKNG